uniref:Uncharacterized protein n=1 Tax=Ditylenchus dipsaci TaxID=166011 RepID=A0A915ER28_9BILA
MSIDVEQPLPSVLHLKSANDRRRSVLAISPGYDHCGNLGLPTINKRRNSDVPAGLGTCQADVCHKYHLMGYYDPSREQQEQRRRYSRWLQCEKAICLVNGIHHLTEQEKLN